MNYFLAKSEPNTYSIDDMMEDVKTKWDGVKNPTARIVMKSMNIGDRIFFYHSGGVCKIMGIMEVISKAYDDPQLPKRSSIVDVRYLAKFDEDDQISLKELKKIEALNQWELIRISRLSVMKVPEEFLSLQKVEKILKKYL